MQNLASFTSSAKGSSEGQFSQLDQLPVNRQSDCESVFDTFVESHPGQFGCQTCGSMDGCSCDRSYGPDKRARRHDYNGKVARALERGSESYDTAAQRRESAPKDRRAKRFTGKPAKQPRLHEQRKMPPRTGCKPQPPERYAPLIEEELLREGVEPHPGPRNEKFCPFCHVCVPIWPSRFQPRGHLLQCGTAFECDAFLGLFLSPVATAHFRQQLSLPADMQEAALLVFAMSASLPRTGKLYLFAKRTDPPWNVASPTPAPTVEVPKGPSAPIQVKRSLKAAAVSPAAAVAGPQVELATPVVTVDLEACPDVVAPPPPYSGKRQKWIQTEADLDRLVPERAAPASVYDMTLPAAGDPDRPSLFEARASTVRPAPVTDWSTAPLYRAPGLGIGADPRFFGRGVAFVGSTASLMAIRSSHPTSRSPSPAETPAWDVPAPAGRAPSPPRPAGDAPSPDVPPQGEAPTADPTVPALAKAVQERLKPRRKLDGFRPNVDACRYALEKNGIPARDVTLRYVTRVTNVDERICTDLNTDRIDADIVYGVVEYTSSDKPAHDTIVNRSLRACDDLATLLTEELAGQDSYVLRLCRSHERDLKLCAQQRKSVLMFCPHLLTAVCQEYRPGTSLETINLNSTARLNQMPKFPLPAVDRLAILSGTSLMLAVWSLPTDVPVSELSSMAPLLNQVRAGPVRCDLQGASSSAGYLASPAILRPNVARGTPLGFALRTLDCRSQSPLWSTTKKLSRDMLLGENCGPAILGPLTSRFLVTARYALIGAILTRSSVALASACVATSHRWIPVVWRTSVNLLKFGAISTSSMCVCLALIVGSKIVLTRWRGRQSCEAVGN